MGRFGQVLWLIAFVLIALTLLAVKHESGIWVLYAAAAVPATLLAYVIAGPPKG